jgi:hypothetical protein
MNAVKALLPGTTVPAVQTPGRAATEFVSWSDQFPVQEAFASQLSDAALNVAEQVGKNAALAVTCATGQDSATCAQGFIDRFVSRAFRRPLQPDERAELVAVYDTGSKSGTGFASGIELVVASTLSAPSFLYRTELGAGGTPGQPVALTAYEVASTLSFTLLNSLPDDELWQRAVDGTLTQRAVLEKQVTRLLALPDAQENLTRVLLSWVDVPAVLTLEKTKEDLAGVTFDNAVRGSLLDEAKRFVDSVLWTGGTVADLFQSRRAFLDPRSAALYGVAAPTTTGAPADLPATRAGLLTRAGLIAAARYGKNPEVFRGRMLRERVLCGQLSDPPPTVNTDTFNAQYAGLSTSQRIALRAGQPDCATCHSFMDKLGIAFDGFGALGQAVTQVNGVAPAPAGELTGTDVDGAFSDLVDLSTKLGKSRVVAQCLVEQMLTYALGQLLDQGGQCARDQIATGVLATNGKLSEIFRGIALNPVFTTRIGGMP